MSGYRTKRTNGTKTYGYNYENERLTNMKVNGTL